MCGQDLWICRAGVASAVAVGVLIAMALGPIAVDGLPGIRAGGPAPGGNVRRSGGGGCCRCSGAGGVGTRVLLAVAAARGRVSATTSVAVAVAGVDLHVAVVGGVDVIVFTTIVVVGDRAVDAAIVIGRGVSIVLWCGIIVVADVAKFKLHSCIAFETGERGASSGSSDDVIIEGVNGDGA